MIKKMRIIPVLIISLLITGCNFNKSELKEENQNLISENTSLEQEIDKAKEMLKVYDFYNEITLSNINSFVLVESKNLLSSKTLYSNGVIILSSGLRYYVLTDYNALSQTGMVRYKVMGANAIEYNATLANTIDTTTGLALLEVDISGYTNVNLDTIKMGNITSLMGYFSSIKQINKIQLINEIKTSSITYNDTSYKVYSLDENNLDNGTILINSDNQLTGIYASKFNCFLSMNLIKQVLYSTYSLVL